MPPTLFPQWRSAPGPAIIAVLVLSCASFADGVLLPYFPLWAERDGGVPVGAIGLLYACYAGGELIATPLIGGVADRVGRRPVLVLSALGVGTGVASLSLVHGIAATACVLLLTGIFESVLHPTAFTIIADVVPRAGHRRWFSLGSAGMGLGRVLGPAAGGLLALQSLQAVFLAGGAVLLLGGAASLVLLAETSGRGSDEAGASGIDEEDEGLSALLPVFCDRHLARLLLWVVLFGVSSGWVEAVIPLYATGARTLTPSGVGALFAYAGALTAVLQLPVSRLSQSVSASRLIAVAGAAAVAGFAVLAASPSAAALVIAVSVFALADMLVGPLVPAVLGALAPATRRASYMAAASVGNDLKDSLGPATGTALYGLAPRLPWLLGIPLAAAAAAGLGLAIARAPGMQGGATKQADGDPGRG